MGCFLSLLSRDSNHPQYATEETEERHQETSSHGVPSRANTLVSGRPSASLAEGHSRASRSARRRYLSQLPLGEHYNERIRPHVWYSKRRLWSHAQLARERKEFFETRVAGRPEVWAALSTAVSLMQNGDFATAQSIIDAAGVTVPTGDLCEGCYDEQGALYRLPQCIVSDPENVVDADSTDDGGCHDEIDGDAMSDGKMALDEASGDELISEDIERRRDEKGKTSERDLIKVIARPSDRDGADVVVSVGKTQSVGFIARKVQQEAGVSSHQRVRIAYLGKILKEHESLPDQGWKAGHVVNALVVTRTSIS